MTLAEFLAWEERQERPYEFDGTNIVAVPDITLAHSSITHNVHKAIGDRLDRKRCMVCGPQLKVLVDGKIRYPDTFVTCGKHSWDTTVIDDPAVVFEVTSKETGRTDRIEKLREYQATESIQRYVILEQTSIGATVFARQGDRWIGFALTEKEILQMPEIGVEAPMAEFYADVELPALPESDR